VHFRDPVDNFILDLLGGRLIKQRLEFGKGIQVLSLVEEALPDQKVGLGHVFGGRIGGKETVQELLAYIVETVTVCLLGDKKSLLFLDIGCKGRSNATGK
jgi:hypothetical protein